MTKVIVLGAGVIGVNSAYFLSEAGYDVTVIEQNSASALACSRANGGQLSYSHAEPWASAPTLIKAMKWMIQKDSPLVFRISSDPHMMKWCLRFVQECTKQRVALNSEAMLRLAFYSKDALRKLLKKHPLSFSHNHSGTLHLFETAQSLYHAEEQAHLQNTLGQCPYEIWNYTTCLEKEPALQYTKRVLYGGIFYPADESGDIKRYTQALAHLCEKKPKNPVTFLYDTKVHSIEKKGKNVHAIITSNGIYHADIYVATLGCYSPRLLRPLGIDIPVHPMKGYSISIPTQENKAYIPRISITDQATKLVYTNLGQCFRVAGTAEFDDYNDSISKPRIRLLRRHTKQLFPKVILGAKVEPWACLRPQTPNSLPIIGGTPLNNLYLNTGHGTLGWTFGCGSGKIIADLIKKNNAEIDLTGFTLSNHFN